MMADEESYSPVTQKDFSELEEIIYGDDSDKSLKLMQSTGDPSWIRPFHPTQQLDTQMYQSYNQPDNQTNNQSEPDYQPDNQPDYQPDNQPNNQTNNQTNNQPNYQLDNQLNNPYYLYNPQFTKNMQTTLPITIPDIPQKQSSLQTNVSNLTYGKSQNIHDLPIQNGSNISQSNIPRPPDKYLKNNRVAQKNTKHDRNPRHTKNTVYTNPKKKYNDTRKHISPKHINHPIGNNSTNNNCLENNTNRIDITKESNSGEPPNNMDYPDKCSGNDIIHSILHTKTIHNIQLLNSGHIDWNNYMKFINPQLRKRFKSVTLVLEY